MPTEITGWRAYRIFGAHVRRYPRWYSAAAIWVAAMMLIPVVEHTPLAALIPSGDRTTPTSVADAQPAVSITGQQAKASVPAPEVPTSSGTPASAEPLRPPTTETGAPPPPTTVPEGPPETIPPELLDQLLDALPPSPGVPPFPEELQPLARALAPIVLHGCSAPGLAQVVLVVVGPSLDDIPIERLLPYLSVVSTACANFPLPETFTMCAADEPVVFDLSGITKTPPPLGLGIDQIEALEQLFGLPDPGLADSLRTQLDCRIVQR